MKSSKQGFSAHGNEHKTHKPSKQDANLQKNSTLRFQIGLLLSSLVVLLLFQMNFKVPEVDALVAVIGTDEVDPYVMTDYTEYVPEKKVEVIKPKIQQRSKEFEVVPDDVEINQAKTEVIIPEDTHPNSNPVIINYVSPLDEVSVPFEKVEFVPIFPGCESLATNAERKECMSEKIDRIVRKNFRTNKALEYGITGKQRIFVQFKIDKQGLVSDIQIRTPHKLLENEARRVTKLIPQMKPGKQRTKDVEVIFIKPITFMVQ